LSRLLSRILPLYLALGVVSAALAAAAPSRTLFPDSIRAVPGAAASAPAAATTVTRTVLRPAEASASMDFEVGLRMRNFDELQARIAKGEVISDAEKAQKYFPLASDHDRVAAWLQAQGLAVTRTDPNHLGIFGRGSVDAVGRAFQATFARVADRTGREFTSAVTAPSLPADLAPLVVGVHGLQPHIRRHPLSTPRAVRAGGGGGLTIGYLPSQIAAAYNATGLTGSPTGAGQTIAIYALGYPTNSDLTAFWTNTAVAQTTANVTQVDVAGGPGSDADDSILEEVSLDVEWAGALAPGAQIRIYGADEDDPANNDEILQQVYADLPNNPTMHILSISIGGNELDVPADYLVIEAQYMANLASAGVTVLVASGDTGSYVNHVLETSYPTSDPDVTGVGGTSIVLTATNTVQSETGWSGSGGGISTVFSRPSWQVGTGVPSGSMRLTPDVAAAADNNNGAYYYYNGQGGEVGGTSWATPTWAGFIALVNQAKNTTMGFLNPKLYPAAGALSGYTRDITSGSNGAYSAGVGYDLVTGLGVPNVTAIVSGTFTTSTAAVVPATTGNQVVTIGQPATFFVVGYGSGLSYQWQMEAGGSSTWSPLSNSSTYSGVTTPMLVVSGTNSGMTGESFRCVVTSGSTTATSPAATLTVNNVGVTTLAGWPGSSGHADGTGWSARFALPGAVRTDAAGNIYVADSSNYTIRRITPGGVVTTVAGIADQAGSADGPVATATFNAVGGVAVDAAGDLFVADSGNYTIREVSAAGVVTTLAGVAGARGDTDGTGAAARFYDPQNLAVDGSGNIYVADGMGNVVRKVTLAGVVTTIAGSGAAGSSDGQGTGAEFNDPTGIAVDYFGNIYVADYGNDTVRKVTPAGVVTTIAGSAGQTGTVGGTGSAARFNGPDGVGVDSSGNVYVADANNNLVRKVDVTNFVTTVAGVAGVVGNTDGLSGVATFDAPGDVTVDSTGIIYLADSENSTIRRIIQGVDSVPFFTAQPASILAAPGATAIFSVGVSGTAPYAFQWNYNGSPILGANTPFYVVTDAQTANEGGYSVTVTNLDGSVTSAAATLTVATPAGDPDITAQPQGGSLSSGSDALSVTVTGTGPFSYQWYLNGTAISGATGSAYTATTAGSYTVAVTNAAGTVTSAAAVVGTVSRLVNLSTRAEVETGAAITIAGFAISGPAGVTKQVMIRGVGPTLTNFSITDFLTTPALTLYDSAGNAIATNVGWTTNTSPTPAQIITLAAEVGAFALIDPSADSVLVVSLPPGTYSAELSGVSGTTGVGLVEVYETSTTTVSVLSNISTRAAVGTGADILIAGFVVEGSQPSTVLIRGIGPALANYGITGTLTAPVLTVFDSTGTQIDTNSGWSSTSANELAVETAEAEVGAFALTSGSADCALVLTLSPGTYSAQVAGADGSTGIALVEVYQIP